MPTKANKQFSVEDVRQHRSVEDMYIIVHDKVYDVTKFIDEHPGGSELLIDQGGADATEAYDEVDHSPEANEMLASFQVGTVQRRPGDDKVDKPYGSQYVAYGGQKGATVLMGAKIKLMIAVIMAGGLGAWLYSQQKSES